MQQEGKLLRLWLLQPSRQGSRVNLPDGAAHRSEPTTSSALWKAQYDANVDPLTGLPLVHGMATHGQGEQIARSYANIRRVGHINL